MARRALSPLRSRHLDDLWPRTDDERYFQLPPLSGTEIRTSMCRAHKKFKIDVFLNSRLDKLKWSTEGA